MLLENVLSGKNNMEHWQWKKIIEKMYDEEDYKLLEEQLSMRIQVQVQEGGKMQSTRGALGAKQSVGSMSSR